MPDQTRAGFLGNWPVARLEIATSSLTSLESCNFFNFRLLLGQRHVQRPDLSIAKRNVGQVATVAVFSYFNVVRAGAQLHDEWPVVA